MLNCLSVLDEWLATPLVSHMHLPLAGACSKRSITSRECCSMTVSSIRAILIYFFLNIYPYEIVLMALTFLHRPYTESRKAGKPKVNNHVLHCKATPIWPLQDLDWDMN